VANGRVVGRFFQGNGMDNGSVAIVHAGGVTPRGTNVLLEHFSGLLDTA
jgi:hypothetical protein